MWVRPRRSLQTDGAQKGGGGGGGGELLQTPTSPSPPSSVGDVSCFQSSMILLTLPPSRPNMATYSHSPLLDSTKFTNCVGYYFFQWFQNSLTCKKHMMQCCFNTIGEFIQYSVFSSPPQRRRRGGDVRLGAYAAASSAFFLSPPSSFFRV